MKVLGEVIHQGRLATAVEYSSKELWEEMVKVAEKLDEIEFGSSREHMMGLIALGFVTAIQDGMSKESFLMLIEHIDKHFPITRPQLVQAH